MKKRILIIEDNEKNRKLEKDLLEIAGFEVFEAMTGAGGIALAQKERPDAIVMDLRLPDMPGSLVAQRLRQEMATCDIPIIFVTASIIGDVRVKHAAIPNTTILTKPFDTQTFAQKISQCIGKSL
jgi:CheY-like chemotaxis protein